MRLNFSRQQPVGIRASGAAKENMRVVEARVRVVAELPIDPLPALRQRGHDARRA